MTENNKTATTHIGSLPRPDRLRDRLGSDGEHEEFDDIANEAIRNVVKKQIEAGLDSINDGEQTRQAFHTFVTDRLEGYSGRDPEPPLWSDIRAYPEYAQEVFGDAKEPKPVAAEAIEYGGGHEIRTDIRRLQAALTDLEVTPSEVFLTAPSPGVVMTHTRNEFYSDGNDYLFDLATALSHEYEIIADEGYTLQIDAPDLLSDAHRYYQDLSDEEFREQVKSHIEAINQAIATVPAEQVRLHACWGNYPGPHHHDIELEVVLPELLEAEVGSLVVEAANPRHNHAYTAFKEHTLPDDWTLTAGVVDVKTNIVEHPETVAERIGRFAEIIGDPTRIQASPDCGFASVAGFHMVHPDIVWEKLETLVRGTRLANERLL